MDQDLLPVLARGRGLETAESLSHGIPRESPALSGLATLEEVERNHILAVLHQSGGVIEGPRGAARILNLHPNTLRRRMKKLGIKRSGHRAS